MPVFAGELKAHVDREGDLTSVNGFAAPDLALDVTPRLSKAEASSKALAAVKAKPSGYEDGGPAGYRKGLTVRDAVLIAERTYRGGDGTTPGLGRERIYLEAFLRVGEHLSARPTDEGVLTSGQVSLDAIPTLATLVRKHRATEPPSAAGI